MSVTHIVLLIPLGSGLFDANKDGTTVAEVSSCPSCMPDHLPVITTLHLGKGIRRKEKARRKFKLLDSELVAEGATAIKDELHNLQLNTITAVDSYCHHLVQKIQCLVAKTVPAASPTTHAKPWWNSTISAAIRKERQLKRAWRNAHTQQAWNDAVAASRRRSPPSYGSSDKWLLLHLRHTLEPALFSQQCSAASAPGV